MLKEYRKKTTIKAEQFDGSKKMIDKYQVVTNNIFEDDYALPKMYGPIKVLHEGDWIVTEADGEHWSIADDIFRRTYEEADDNDC